MKRLALPFMILLWLAQWAHGAELTLHELEGGGTAIQIHGFIDDGDYQQFETLAEIAPDKDHIEVWLDSPGGYDMIAYAIGATIHKYGLDTVVVPHKICASACAYIWLAGRLRYLSSTSDVGFHAPYLAPGGPPQELKNAYASVGYYFRDIGITNLDFLAWSLEKEGASNVNWLRPAEAKRFGVVFIQRDTLPVLLHTKKPSLEDFCAELGSLSSVCPPSSALPSQLDDLASSVGKQIDEDQAVRKRRGTR
jgi:ATP-dependent protease ClpP protease subunit